MGTMTGILIALAVGLFIGSRSQSAHEAHLRFTSYRTRTNDSLGAWLKSTAIAALGIAALILLLYLIL
jgi:hypothetical protein